MDITTDDRVNQEREESIQQTLSAGVPRITAEVMAQILEQLKNLLADKYFTPDDLKSITSDVIKTVTGDTARWQQEQTSKLDTFISEMRGRMDTFVSLPQFESLRTTVEDSHRHFVAITGGHGEAIEELKSQVKSLKDNTQSSIAVIRAASQKVVKSVLDMKTTLDTLIAHDTKRQTQLDEVKKLAEENQKQLEAQQKTTDDRHKKTTEDIDRIQEDIRNQAVKWIEFSEPLKSIPARMLDLETSLKSALWLLNSWGGRAVLGTILTLFTVANRTA